MQLLDQITIKVVESDTDLQHVLAIRRKVFVEEQSVPEEIEMDDFDDAASHVLARLDGKPVGTARWRRTGQGMKLERFAVPRSMRGRGIGKAMLMFILDRVIDEDQIYLHAQTPVVSFYEKYGFRCVGQPFEEAGISHRKMVYRHGLKARPAKT